MNPDILCHGLSKRSGGLILENSRLFETIYYLLNHKKTTAAALANHFEVSTRTIYRDLDTLSKIGIPIYTEPGRNGGIRLLQTFVLEKTLLSAKEQDNLLLALKGTQTLNPEISEQSFSKLKSLFNIPYEDWLEIDFSQWHQLPVSDNKFNELKFAILHKRQIHFHYVSPKGTSEKRVCHPVKLLFKSQAWYCQAYCIEKEAFRTFKINRMYQIEVRNQTFSPMKAPEDTKLLAQPKMISVTLHFSKEILYRVFDEFSYSSIVMQKDGSAHVTAEIPDQEWLVRYLLSFGRYVTVLQPETIRQQMIEEIKQIRNLLDQDYINGS
jgi:predicted DNA-binding transcriptional regulator YafY